ncbi:undecaprenyl diphosphate synthase [Aquipluma nitroreducens]|uniref:Isoprenyl transferase n=1 Tax=Aquipluma nitroreducens TaxID=2010828 RepID=A0A5K7SFB0_9BACT|nr:isoprenyl transferase [Aquipluma nitroreducens]BBE19924.1 undecaprenyl diphosphate synthase [Aquipluma nitroreducens]
MSFKDKLIKDKVPKHVAIIMDGNGRWAAQFGNERTFGHEHGVDAVRSVVEGAGEIGVEYLTLYAFSTENWSRPKEEVDALMGLFVQAISEETDELLKNNVRLRAIGDISSLPINVQEKFLWSIDKLKSCTGLTLVIAISYSSKWEIIEAVRQIAEQVKLGKIQPSEIDNSLMECYLNTSEMPDPELLIRTSGECRISNFLLWQIAYSELYFTPKLWPDFRKEDLFEAIFDFQNRERRFGKTGQQLIS